VSLERAFSKLDKSRFFTYEFEINVELSAKRFEYTFEVLWKTIRLWLKEEKGIECYSPADCFKSAYQTGLIPSEYEQDFVAMIRKRNEIVHIYNEESAKDIYEAIVFRFIDAMRHVIASLACKDTEKQLTIW